MEVELEEETASAFVFPTLEQVSVKGKYVIVVQIQLHRKK